MPNGMMPGAMPGVAPPPMAGPRRMQGADGKEKTAGLIEAARILLKTIEQFPELAKAVHPIVDQLTKVIHQSVAPTRPPSLDGMELPSGPGLDATPTDGGAESGTSSAMIARMLGARG